MKRTLAWVSFGACAAWLLLLAVPRPAPERSRALPVPAVQTAAPTTIEAHRDAPDPLAARRELLEAVERDAVTVTKTNLQAHLDGLLARARAQGRITALEAEAGLELIERVDARPEMRDAFSQRLNALARELNGRASATLGREPRDEIAALDARLQAGDFADEQERAALLDSYRAAAEALDPEQQPPVLQRLNALADRQRQPPAAVDLDEQFRKVEDSSGEMREQAIKQLLSALDELPPDDHSRHLHRLNALVHPQ